MKNTTAGTPAATLQHQRHRAGYPTVSLPAPPAIGPVKTAFLNNEPAQLDQFDILANRNFRQIRANKWADLNNVADVAGMLAAMHLGGGNVKYMVNHGKEPSDPNGTLLSTYYSQKGAVMCGICKT